MNMFYIILLFAWINSIFCQTPEGLVQFYLYNINYPNGIAIHNLSPSEIEIDSSQPLKIWFHGVITNSTATWNKSNTEFYIDRGYNYIGVDYYEHSFYYVAVIWKMDVLRQFIGNFLIKFCDELSVSYADIHMLGHSLGAHLAGQVGRYIYDNTSEKVGRITALDPPDLLFNSIYSDKRLTQTDALFVDAIHTSSMSAQSLGHADFYPDGGSVGQIFEMENDAHSIVLDLYTESLNSVDFIAKNCSTYIRYLRGRCSDNVQAIMGENCDPSARGNFFLDLNGEPPFARGNNTEDCRR